MSQGGDEGIAWGRGGRYVLVVWIVGVVGGLEESSVVEVGGIWIIDEGARGQVIEVHCAGG